MGRVRILGANTPPEMRRAVKALDTGQLGGLERDMVPQMKEAMRRHLRQVVEDCIRDTRVKPHTGRTFIALRDGQRVYGTRFDDLRAEVWGPEYVHALEYGAVIRPKRAKVLTLPMPAALRPDGTPKFLNATSWKRYGTFSYQSRRTGRGYLAYKNAAGQLVLLYVYVPFVTVRALLGLRAAWDRALPDLVEAWGDIMVDRMLAVDLDRIVGEGQARGLAGLAAPVLRARR